MARAQLTNNATTTTTAAITTTGQTTVSVASSTGFPAVTTASGQYFYATLLDAANVPEIIKVTDNSTTTWTFARAQDGTTARTFTSGALVQLNAIKANFDELLDVTANSQGASYTLALTDRGQSIDFTGSTAQTITIPANGSVAFPVGSTVTITNTTANSLSIGITTDTLRLAGTATVGTRTLAQYGVATVRKVASTVWIISGAGLT